VWQGFVAKKPEFSSIRELATPVGTYTQSVSAVERTTAPHQAAAYYLIYNYLVIVL